MTDEKDMVPETENDASTRGMEDMRSKYEFVMAASKEAERLNDRYRREGFRPTGKVTVEAALRIRQGLSRIAYEEPHLPSDEPAKESTYYFNS